LYTSHHKFEHVFEGAPQPDASYVICSLPRSGSSLLCDVLANTELAGAPMEFFDRGAIETFRHNWGVGTFDEYLEALLAKKTSPNGVFGLKLLFGQLAELEGRELQEILPNLHFVYITRKDHVRQAVSFARATQTEQWASDHLTPVASPVYDGDQIREMLEWVERDERFWEGYFEHHSISPLRIAYENFIASVEPTVSRVMDCVGIERPEGFRLKPATLEQQADELSEEWVERFLSTQV
jgi:trehalose 2-sulfotransferase